MQAMYTWKIEGEEKIKWRSVVYRLSWGCLLEYLEEETILVQGNIDGDVIATKHQCCARLQADVLIHMEDCGFAHPLCSQNQQVRVSLMREITYGDGLGLVGNGGIGSILIIGDGRIKYSKPGC